MLKSEMYTVLLTNGSYFITRDEAEKIMVAFRNEDIRVEISVRAPNGEGATVSILIATVLGLIAHDTDVNVHLERWKNRHRKNVVSLSDYVANSGRPGKIVKTEATMERVRNE